MLNRLLLIIEHTSTAWDWQEWAAAFACLYLVAFVFLTVLRGRN